MHFLNVFLFDEQNDMYILRWFTHASTIYEKKHLIKNIEIYYLFLRFIVEVYPLRPPEGAFL